MNRETVETPAKLTKQEENWLLMTGLQIPWSECNKITDEEDRKFLLEKAEEVRALVLQQQEQQSYPEGVTTYADLNSKSSGSDTYSGDRSALIVLEAAENAAEQATVGKTIGSFQATHEINYSTRTITQAANIIIDALGSNTTQRSFTVEKGHSYSITDTSNVEPSAAFTVDGQGTSNVINSSITGEGAFNDVTAGNTYLEDSQDLSATNYLVTVNSGALNTTSDVANTIQTGVSVESNTVSSGVNIAAGNDGGATKD